MSKHTPGPWVLSETTSPDLDGSTAVSAVDPENGQVFDVCAVWSGGDDVSAANARLIAAAPDLLEALKRCRFDSLNMSLADLDFCHAAYAKATGDA